MERMKFEKNLAAKELIVTRKLTKLTSHFGESSLCCRQCGSESLDMLVLVHDPLMLMAFWLVFHCTPTKHVQC